MDIEKVTVLDAYELSEIYKPYVENTTYSFEYVAPDAEEFKRRIKETAENYPYFKAVENGVILGYAYAHRYRERAAYGWDAEVSVYIKPDMHRSGIGTALYEKLLAELKKQNVVNVYALITSPNIPSEEFHKKFGFTLSGTAHKTGFKHGKWHDMSEYELRISDVDTPKEFIPYKYL